MPSAEAGAILLIECSGGPEQPSLPERPTSSRDDRQETAMKRNSWQDAGLAPADARFLMLTAITHHRFSSPIWGRRELRKLNAELAEFDALAYWVISDHYATRHR
jgi:hypothetical protein